MSRSACEKSKYRRFALDKSRLVGLLNLAWSSLEPSKSVSLKSESVNTVLLRSKSLRLTPSKLQLTNFLPFKISRSMVVPCSLGSPLKSTPLISVSTGINFNIDSDRMSAPLRLKLVASLKFVFFKIVPLKLAP